MSEVLKKEQRDALFAKLRDDAKLRAMLKKDWKAALKSVNIDPATVAKGTLSRREVESFANQRAGWEIIIVISARQGLDKIRVNEAVNFEAR
jgi:hypothetical protein